MLIRLIKKIAPKNITIKFFLVLFLASCGLLYATSVSPGVLMSIGDITFGGNPPRFYSIHSANIAYTRASKLLTKDNKPTPWAYYQRGRIAFIQGDLDQALYYFNQELAYYPLHTKVHYMKGLTFGYMGMEKEGIKEFQWYINNTNDSWASFNDLAWLQFRIGDIDGAIATIEPVAKTQEYNPWTANTYAVLLMNKGRNKEAKEVLEKGIITLTSMSEDSWGVAYPGNNPKIYKEGLQAMKESLQENMLRIESNLAKEREL